jgi:hypothetical protein
MRKFLKTDGLTDRLEGWPLLFTILTTIAILIGGLVQFVRSCWWMTTFLHRNGHAMDAARVGRPRHLHPGRLQQLPFAGGAAVPS